MHLHGRLSSIDNGQLTFAGDLARNLDAADATAERIKDTIDRWIEKQDLDAPSEARYQPVWTPDGDGSGTVDIESAEITSVIWATGFHSDWSWIDVPGFTRQGYPTHERGVTSVPGLYVLGLPWLHTWGSGRFAGVTRDAEHLVGQLARRARVPATH